MFSKMSLAGKGRQILLVGRKEEKAYQSDDEVLIGRALTGHMSPAGKPHTIALRMVLHLERWEMLS